MSILREQLESNRAEAKRLWAEADASTDPYERYGLAWGAMDCDLACQLLTEAIDAMYQDQQAA